MGSITLSGAGVTGTTGGDLNFHPKPGSESINSNSSPSKLKCTGTTSPTSLSVAGSSTSVASSTKENRITSRKKSFDSNHLGLPFEYNYNRPVKRKHDSHEITDSSKTVTGSKAADIDENAFAGPKSGGDDADEDEDDEDDDDDDEDGDGVYIVEKIEGKRHVGPGRAPYYLIKWKGWDASANTWEHVKNLGGCSELVDAFEQSEEAKKRKSQKSGTSNKRRRTYSDLDDEVKIIEDNGRNVKSYGVLLEWPADKEPISVEGVINVDDVLTYVVKRKARLGSSHLDRSNAILVRSEDFRKWFPELIIEFYEKRIVWNEQVRDNDEQADVASQMALLCKNRCSRMEPKILKDNDVLGSVTSHPKGSQDKQDEDILVIHAENVDLDFQTPAVHGVNRLRKQRQE